MKNIIICLIIFSSILNTKINTLACGQYYTIDIHGHKHLKSEAVKIHSNGFDGNLLYTRNFDKLWVLERLEKLEESLTKNYNYKKHSDYAMLLSTIGKVKEALQIMERLNQEHPDEYNLMANLGTLYELNGKNKKALFWIKKALEKNAESHRGSEWIHVKILEAKLKIAKDPNWLQKNHIIDISQYNNAQKLEKLERHLNYQLNERIPYTPNPDPIVFQLLMDLAEVSKKVDLDNAHKAYHFALIFTGNKQEKENIKKKIEDLESTFVKYEKEVPKSAEYGSEGKVVIASDYRVIDFFADDEVTFKQVVKTEFIEESFFERNKTLFLIIIGIVSLLAILAFIFFRKKKG